VLARPESAGKARRKWNGERLAGTFLAACSSRAFLSGRAQKEGSGVPAAEAFRREMPERFRLGNDSGRGKAHSPLADLRRSASQRWQTQKDPDAKGPDAKRTQTQRTPARRRNRSPSWFCRVSPSRKRWRSPHYLILALRAKNGPDTLAISRPSSAVSRPRRPS